MVDFCREHGLPHEVCGKVIVATSDEEIPRLKVLHERGQANGLAGLQLLKPEQVREIEPHCTAVLGLLVPSTGITDYAAVARKYAEIVAAQGGTISTATEVRGLVRRGTEMIVETTHPTAGPTKAIGLPIKFSETPGGVRRAAPVFGQDTRDVLREQGYSDDEIDQMAAQGAIRLPATTQKGATR